MAYGLNNVTLKPLLDTSILATMAIICLSKTGWLMSVRFVKHIMSFAPVIISRNCNTIVLRVYRAFLYAW